MFSHTKKIFCLLIIAVGFFWAQASDAAGWVAQSSGITTNLRSIDVVDSAIGFAVGDGGKILKTSNGGQTWSVIYTSSGDTFYGIDMISANTGWVVGLGGKIFKTTDGGSNWNVQGVGVTNYLLHDVSAVNSSEAAAVGAGGVALRTTDGGATWVLLQSDLAGTLYGVKFSSCPVQPNPAGRCIFAVGTNGVIVRAAYSNVTDTPDWTAQTSGTTVSLYEIEQLIAGSASFYISGAGGAVLGTTDYGLNWTKIQPATLQFGFESIAAFSGPKLIAVGGQGAIFKGIQSGGVWSWSAESSGTTQTLYGVSAKVNAGSFVDAWAVGAAGTIVRYDETPPSDVGSVIKTAVNKDNTPSFTWLAATDDINGTYGAGIVKYEYSVDGAAYVNNGNGVSLTLTQTADGAHTLSVRAVDAAANAGAAIVTDFTIDTTAPNVAVAEPGAATVGVAQKFTASYSDNIGVAGCYFIVNSVQQGSVDTAGAVSGIAEFNHTFSSAGSYSVYFSCTDASSNFGYGFPVTTVTVSAVPTDTTAPTGSITINSGAAYTNSSSVTLTLSCSDNVACTRMMVAVDGAVDTEALESFSTSKTVTLSGSDGVKTVAVKFKDSATNASAQYSDTIILDKNSPTVGAISPATATANSAQSFTASYSDTVGVTSCELYVNNISQGNMSLAGTTSGTATKSLTLFVIDSYEFKAKCSDGTNTTWGAATTVVASPAGGSDTTAPTGSVTINAGAAYTKSSSVTLALSCSDNVACTYMIVAVDGTVDTESLESFSTSKTVSLSGGNGTKTVAVKFKDASANTSAQYTDTISLDTVKPSVGLTTPSSAVVGVIKNFSASYSDSNGVVSCSLLVNDTVKNSVYMTSVASGVVTIGHTFSAAGSYNVYITCNDDSDNTGFGAATTVVVSASSDTTAPSVGAITPTTAQATLSQSFTASYSDAVDVASCDLYVDSSNQGSMTLSGATAGTASRSYTFSDTTSHTLQARCLDAAGNIGLGALTTVSVSAAPANQVDTSEPSAPSSVKKISDDTDKTPTFNWNAATDNSGVTSYVIQIDNGSLIDIGGALTYTTGELSSGSHTIKVYAKDAAGNSSAVTTFNFTVNTSTPAPAPVSCSLTINGAYKLTGSPAVYYITDECAKRPFNKSNVFFTYFDAWSDVKVTTKIKLDKIPLDTLGFMPWGPKYDPKYGALVKIVTDPKVYLLLGGEKYWITAEQIFEGLNYSWGWIEDIDKKLLDKYITGYEINYTDHHPNYTLVKYAASSKVYRLEPDPADSDKQVKRHIKNEKVFNALNFRWDRIVTISKTEVYKDGEELGEEDV